MGMASPAMGGGANGFGGGGFPAASPAGVMPSPLGGGGGMLQPEKSKTPVNKQDIMKMFN